MMKSLLVASLCLLFAGTATAQSAYQNIGGGGSGTAAGGVFFSADMEAGAGAIAMATADTFYVMDPSLVEVKDVTNAFTVNTGDEVCYTGTANIEVVIAMSMSFSMTTNTGILTFAFGKGATTAIADGDEINLGVLRVVGAAGNIIGSVSATTTLSTDECISLLAASNANTSAVTMTGVSSMTITEPGTGGSGDSAVAGASGDIQYNNAGNHGGFGDWTARR